MKPRLSLIWPPFLAQLAEVLAHGDEKHSPMGWLDQTIAARVDALFRHTLALSGGEDRDPDTGKCHAIHIAAQAMILAFLVEHGVSGTARDGRRFAVPFALEAAPLADSVRGTLDAVVPLRTLGTTLAKLVEEAQEADAAINSTGLADELADVGICLLDAAHLAGVALPNAIMRKLGTLAGRDYAADGSRARSEPDLPYVLCPVDGTSRCYKPECDDGWCQDRDGAPPAHAATPAAPSVAADPAREFDGPGDVT